MKEFEVKKRIITFFKKKKESFVSGEEISNSLGFSRASVWKYITKLREEGYDIEAVPHLGYKLKRSPDKLYGYEVSAGLSTKIIGQGDIYHFDAIDSTNDKAYELAEEGALEGTVVIAETQTKGKGRMGRKWVSPRSGGIYASIILRPDLETDELPAITLITATAIINTIKKTAGIEAGMKWPNDILVGDKKISGILTEIKAQPDIVDFLILGIGVNVNTSKGKLPPEGTSIKVETGEEVSRMELVQSMLLEIEEVYSKFKKKGFSSLRKECKKLSSVLGKKVKIEEHHRKIEGVAFDIDEKGALIIKDEEGKFQRVFSGDVVLPG